MYDDGSETTQAPSLIKGMSARDAEAFILKYYPWPESPEAITAAQADELATKRLRVRMRYQEVAA